ncbi:MAG: DMT family transporter [bacterium]|nr:DMT family transporter [bacterium]
MNPIFALIITNLIWGAASPIFKFALGNIPPFTLAFIRFFFAGLIFIPLAIRSWQKMSQKDLMEILIAGFFGITINISFFFIGLEKANSINAPVIASAGPVFIYIFSIIFLREKSNNKVLIGMLFSLIGVLVIIFSPIIMEGKKVDFGAVEGNILFLIATFGAVFNTIFNKEVLKRINPYQTTCISFLFGALTFSPFMVRELSTWSFSQLDIHGWVGIIYGIFFSSALAYFLYSYGISKLKAQEVGVFTYIDPVIATLLAIPLLHEYPNIYFVIGAFLIFGGIFLAEKRINWHPIQKLKESYMSNKQFFHVFKTLDRYDEF